MKRGRWTPRYGGHLRYVSGLTAEALLGLGTTAAVHVPQCIAGSFIFNVSDLNSGSVHVSCLCASYGSDGVIPECFIAVNV